MKNYKKDNYQIYCWCCDLHSNTGEGRLAYLFLDYLLKVVKKIEIGTYKTNFHIWKKIYKKNYRHYKLKLILIYLENMYCHFLEFLCYWINYFKSKKLFYINYLPLWNIFIFLLAPPKTNFGPITGSIYSGKVYNLNTFVRKYIFHILYKISYLLLLIRKKKNSILNIKLRKLTVKI